MRGWQTGAAAVVMLASLWLMILHGRQNAAWAERLSRQGGAAPAADARSKAGYVLGQRQFLGTHERGETYRSIARTQDFFAAGPLAWRTYSADNVPVGRPELAPRLYTFWLAALAWSDHALTGRPIGLAAERVAAWEPIASQVFAFVALVVFMWRRFGAAAAAAAGCFFAIYPLAAGQFLPGVLTPRTGALLLATYGLSRHICRGRTDQPEGYDVTSTLAVALSLWLDPAIGFSTIVISGAVGVVLVLRGEGPVTFLRWSTIGAALATLAWWIDNPVWSPSAGELRYVHPLYALAWLGMGVALDAGQRLRRSDLRQRRPLLQIAFALPLLGALVYTQIRFGYKGWLYPSAAMERLTSIDETMVFHTFFDWIAAATPGEALFLCAPAVAVVSLLAWCLWQSPRAQRSVLVTGSVVVAGLLVFACAKIRWEFVVAMAAPPLIASTVALQSAMSRRWLTGAIVVFLVGLFVWDRTLPASLRRPSEASEPTAADINALVYRHFAHWLAAHNPGQTINALAPPELSDSLIFHGGSHALMSTAWQSYPGQVAASRFLSAPESTEAEAVLQSREISHVILPSWDEVLPLLVHAPPEKDKTTLYSRLQRWVFPPYLRPIPYHLPPVPGYADQKLVVFKVVPAQDEALSLARLAEYFVEMDRREPATLVAKVLAESYPDDPNAAIARATVAAYVGDRGALDREITRLAAEVSNRQSSSSWDRRVQRAIVFALSQRHDLERAEVAACVAETTNESLFTLTPLQAYRLVVLAKHQAAEFPTNTLAALAESLGADYLNTPGSSSPR